MNRRTLYAHVAHPLYHALARDGVNAALAELRKNETLSAQDLRLVCQDKLARLLTHAARSVPYYSRVIGEMGLTTRQLAEPENFRRLPILTKSIIREQLDSLTSRNLTNNSLSHNSTSGSTGEALRFYTDSKSKAYRKASVIRNYTWAGIRPGDKEVRLWGSPIDEAMAKRWRGRVHSFVTSMRFLSAYEMTEDRMQAYLQLMRGFRPALLVSYPSILEIFAQYCVSHGANFESLKSIITSAEMLTPQQRGFFEQVFRAPVFNRYGCREVGDIAHECAAHTGLHVNSDRIYVEILDSTSNSCAPGEVGEMIVTDLDNFGMPFIRYRIADSGAFATTSHCECGRPMPLLAVVEGRSMDVVTTPNGNRVGGTFWTILLRSRPGMKQFQVHQRDLSGIAVNYVPDGHMTPETVRYFKDEIHKKCGRPFEIIFNEVQEISQPSSGKRRLVLSDVTGAETIR